MNQEVIIFDLDHTLIKTDLLHEQCLTAIKKNFLHCFSILMALFKGSGIETIFVYYGTC